ncbi:hypothetical protein CEXT_764411 [Caerostris extrusa]|uniref:Uncharacterized protein n=1 Tax=Caerostris extrusa TaxID=172846 RepID=A0AAV4MML6_CAEEX|nr:hypothetical protein CEXT_764411 [Caerostris extrusa]
MDNDNALEADISEQVQQQQDSIDEIAAAFFEQGESRNAVKKFKFGRLLQETYNLTSFRRVMQSILICFSHNASRPRYWRAGDLKIFFNRCNYTLSVACHSDPVPQSALMDLIERCKGKGELRALVSEKGRKTGIRSIISFISIMCVFMLGFESTFDLDVVDFSGCLSVAKLCPRGTSEKCWGGRLGIVTLATGGLLTWPFLGVFFEITSNLFG